MSKVERALHEAFSDHRVRKSREFFQLDPYRAKVILELLAIEDITPRDDVIAEPADAEALAQARKHRSKFAFSMADVPVGSQLLFSKGEGLTATVLDETRIDFRGQATSLSAAALTLLKELGYSTPTAQGPAYWLFDGETLDDRRRIHEEAIADALPEFE